MSRNPFLDSSTGYRSDLGGAPSRARWPHATCRRPGRLFVAGLLTAWVASAARADTVRRPSNRVFPPGQVHPWRHCHAR